MTSQKKTKEIDSLAGALERLRPRLNPTSGEHELQSIAKLDARSEHVLKVVLFTEAAVQIRLDEEQRAQLVHELVETDWPSVILICASYILTSGRVQLYGRLDMGVWRAAVKQVPKELGKLNQFFREGWIQGREALWREIHMGTHTDTIKEILEELT